ncbi:MAG: rhomboid family intramembrane serine protease [Planctomycetota bacterium]
MFIPYSTDAPIYHLPIATVGLIVANSMIFFAALTGNLPNPELWILPYGEGLTPAQWLLSMFMHGSLDHLLGNMLFLWVFGLVIEGKIGWQRFLACYLGIGIAQSIGEQSLQLMLGGEGGSLGASSAIYGLMAMAAVWAPKNDIIVFYWFFLIFAGTFEISIMVVAMLYIGFDFVLAFFLGFNSSSWLHIGGAILGAPLAIVMLKRDVVDCEGWDIFHIVRDDKGGLEEKKRRTDPEELARLRRQRDAKTLDEGKTQIEKFMVSGYYLPAYALYQKLRSVGAGVELSRGPLIKMISALHKEKRWRESCPLMAECVRRFPDASHGVQIKLAEICVLELEKPGRAIELLKRLDLRAIPPERLDPVKKIAQKAKRMQAEGIVELDDDRW